MKNPVTLTFEDWLTFMEDAYRKLTKSQFRELEEKIKSEIAFHRKRPAKESREAEKNG